MNGPDERQAPGMFANRSNGRGQAFKSHRAKKSRELLDRFADLLADEVEPGSAAIRMGYTAAYGRVLLSKIRAGLGWQAK